jgi:hypothetical protein
MILLVGAVVRTNATITPFGAKTGSWSRGACAALAWPREANNMTSAETAALIMTPIIAVEYGVPVSKSSGLGGFVTRGTGRRRSQAAETPNAKLPSAKSARAGRRGSAPRASGS